MRVGGEHMKGIGRGLFSGLLIAVMAVAMACGGSSDSGGGGGDPLAPKGGSSSSAAKGDLRLVGSDPLTLDPHTAQDSGSAAYIVEIFGGLVTLDQSLKVVPDI